RDVLHADAGEIRHGDLLWRRPAGRLPRADPAELDEGLHDVRRVLKLAESPALFDGVGSYKIGSAEDLRVQLLLADAVRADGRQVDAWLEPVGQDDGLARS